MEEQINLIRSFIAIDLSREAINEIKRLQEILRKKNLFTGKFTEPENLHLTLKFLGEIREEKIEEVKKKLSEIKFESFEAHLDEVGVFSEKYVKIIWIKLGGKGVFDLQKNIDEKLIEIFEKEERFMSHITIARVRDVSNRKELLEYLKSVNSKELRFKVDRFFLKKSELKSSGPEYSDLGEYVAG